MDASSQLMDLHLGGFLDVLASSSPAPGGGSVAALSLSLGASLVEMVCALTIGRKKYADVESMMESLKERARLLRRQADDLVQRDTDAYNTVMKAYALPKENDVEKAARRESILNATRVAIETPLTTARQSLRLFEMALQVLEAGNINAASDALVAAYLANAAGMSALANVRINLSGLSDDTEIAALQDEVSRIETTLQQFSEKAQLLGKVRIG